MNYGEIMNLVQAGFTPDQITQLVTTSGAIPSAPESVPEVTTPPAPGPSESPIKEEAPAPDPAPDASSKGESEPDPLDEIRETVRQLQAENEDLKKQIQSANIRDRTVETVSGPDASATLAEIIRPTFHKGG